MIPLKVLLTRDGFFLVLGSVLGASPIAALFQWFFDYAPSIPTYFYDNAEVIGLISPIFFMISFAIMSRGIAVSPNDSWWKYVLFGAIGPPVVFLFFIGAMGSLFILPLLVPIKVIFLYAIAQDASLDSTLIALLVVIVTIGLAFTFIYMAIILSRKGDLRLEDGSIYLSHVIGESSVGVFFKESIYFSLATMLASNHLKTEPHGWCRWIALIQLFVTKVIEIVVVSVGVGMVVSNWAS